MDIDPHTLQQILQRIHQQMRCPQCGSRVPVDFSSVQVVASNAMILQLKCGGCGAFIVLNASVAGGEEFEYELEGKATVNTSSKLNLASDEAKMLGKALDECDGSFEKLFEKYGGEKVEGEQSKYTLI